MKLPLLLIATCLVAMYAAIPITTIPPKSTGLEDIIKMIPIKEIHTIAEKHLKTDEGFKAAIQYMQGEDWKELINAIKEKPEWKRLKSFLKELDIDVEALSMCPGSFLANVTVTADPNAKPNLKSFMTDVEQVLPVGQIILSTQQKMQTPEFQEKIKKMASESSKKMVTDVMALKEVQKVMKIVNDMGLPINEILSIFFNFLGWNDINVVKN